MGAVTILLSWPAVASNIFVIADTMRTMCACSLRQSMKTGRATPTEGSAESTVCADVESVELNGVSVRLYDCAGQVLLGRCELHCFCYFSTLVRPNYTNYYTYSV